MRHNPNYLLREIAHIPYLLPYGQLIADHRPGVRLNKTGAWLWRQIETNQTTEGLRSLFVSQFAPSPEELPFLEKDLSQFLHTLQLYHMLENDPSHTDSLEPTQAPLSYPSIPPTDAPRTSMCIGGLHIKIIGPREALGDYFHGYESCFDTTCQTITLRFPASDTPQLFCSGHMDRTPLLHSRDLVLFDMGDFYLLLFPSMKYIREAWLAKDASQADIHCVPGLRNPLREELFHAIRFLFLYLAQKHHMMVLHSASLLYRRKAWLFSGSSGTGKSTHTNLWHKQFHVPLLNGDLNLLALENGKPVIHGLPWCGTSGISQTGTYPLGGIILLKQSQKDFMETLSPDARQLLVLQRLISPLWTPDQLDACLDFVDALADHIYIARLHCTQKNTAAETARQEIDAYISP